MTSTAHKPNPAELRPYPVATPLSLTAPTWGPRKHRPRQESRSGSNRGEGGMPDYFTNHPVLLNPRPGQDPRRASPPAPPSAPTTADSMDSYGGRLPSRGRLYDQC